MGRDLLEGVGRGGDGGLDVGPVHLDGDVEVSDGVGVELDGVGLAVFARHRHMALAGGEHQQDEECGCEEEGVYLFHNRREWVTAAKLRKKREGRKKNIAQMQPILFISRHQSAKSVNYRCFFTIVSENMCKFAADFQDIPSIHT